LKSNKTGAPKSIHDQKLQLAEENKKYEKKLNEAKKTISLLEV
jgi:hypothetical protein